MTRLGPVSNTKTSPRVTIFSTDRDIVGKTPGDLTNHSEAGFKITNENL